MKKNVFLNLLNQKILFLDGAYGTEFMKSGYNDKLFELLNLYNPQVVLQLHKKYIEAGADIIITNTFSANLIKLSSYKFEDKFEIINEIAVKIAREAANENSLVFGDIGPTGILLKPFGEISFEEAYTIFKKQTKILIENDVDGIILETFSDIKELKAAILAVRDINEDIPLIAQMTFTEHGKTITGTSIEIFATVVNELNVDVAGINCYLSPEGILPIFTQFAKYCNKPLSIEPNAGKPEYKNGKIIYDSDPAEFAFCAMDYVDAGANIIGGCCGTNPAFIEKITKTIGKRRPNVKEKDKGQYLSSRIKLVPVAPFLVVGEKINASSSKKVERFIREKQYGQIINMAQMQQNQGAQVIDINFGDEKKVIPKNVENLILELDKNSINPLSLDIQDIDLLETALKEYPARALINSSIASKRDIETHLNLIKRYGGMLIILAMGNKVSQRAISRIKIIKRVIEIIKEYQIDIQRIFFDPLILPISSGNDYKVSLKTIEFINKTNLKSIIGLSNLTYGITEKEKINSFFLALAMEKGLNAVICNCSHQTTMNIIDGNLKLKGITNNDKILEYDDPIVNMLIKGETSNLIDFINQKLKEFNPLYISETILRDSMKKIGELYNEQKIFLPHLIISSETVQKAFEYISQFINKKENIKKGKIMLATVEGDIHDIGKKIVATILRATGFDVIDIGKNINSKTLYRHYMNIKPDIIGLSAMMTSTTCKIKEIVDYFKNKGVEVKIIAGGATMNKNIADEFNVYYAKDAIEAIDLCNKLIGISK